MNSATVLTTALQQQKGADIEEEEEQGALGWRV